MVKLTITTRSNYMKLLYWLLFIMLSFVSVNVLSHGSGPQGFDKIKLTSVKAIYKEGKDGDYVILQGRLTDYYQKDRYEFIDLNNDVIEVELDDEYDWSHIAKDMLIEIEGKLDRDFFSTHVEVMKASPLSEL